MNKQPNQEITVEQIETFHRDGVVLLPGLFDTEWVKLLDKGLVASQEKPTDRSRVWDRDSEGRTMTWDSQAWQGVEEYQQFIFDSPAAKIAGHILKAQHINFYFDAVFVRSPG